MNRMIIVLLFLLTSCAGLIKNRTFIDEMDRKSDGFFRAGEDFAVVPGDSGNPYRSREDILRRTPASFKMRERYDHELSMQKELSDKEKSLMRNEYQDYIEDKYYLENESERLYYLGLPKNERTEYIRTKRGEGAASSQNRNNISYVDYNQSGGSDIAIGMRKDKVVNTWGRPSRVDVAGDPRNQNERWSYYSNGQVRHVYIEKGEVEGWAIE